MTVDGPDATLECGRGPVPVYVFPDEDALGGALAEKILAGIAASSRGGARYLLGCPGGRSVASTYRALGRLAAAAGTNMSGTVIVMMDNYVERRDGSFRHCPRNAHYSCERFAREHIRAVVNERLTGERRIPDGNIWLPDPDDPPGYDRRIRSAGDIDLFIVASGASDGHVAFNPPGSDVAGVTRIVELAPTTRRDNLGTFPGFESIDDVPAYGVSVGVGTILSRSREIACVIHGPHKKDAVRELASRRSYDAAWPATLIYEGPAIGLFLDRAAAEGLCVNETPFRQGGTS